MPNAVTDPGGDPDYGQFGRPLFDDPEARAVSRVGVIDIGSNSIRMVVFDGAARSPAYFFNEKVMCGLGQGVGETGRLNPEGRRRAVAAMTRFAMLADEMSAGPVITVATAAMREAADGPEFQAELEAATGLTIWVIDGAEEARLSAQGVLVGWPEAEGLVCDIGGSSMELARLAGGRVGARTSAPLGPLRLTSQPGGKKAVKSAITTGVATLKSAIGPAAGRLYLVGGSWRAIARIDMDRRGYPLHVLHEYRMGTDDIAATTRRIADADITTLRRATGISESRMSLVPMAAQVLSELVSQLKPSEIAISAYGIREGTLYDQMPQRLRDRDPLIESCRFTEKKDARYPGSGRNLYRFVLPLFEDQGEARLRIVRAACLLHDVNWRAHPDYRHEACFDSVTRANMGGLTHQERVFLGLALLHRYKNNRSGNRFEPLLSILSKAEIQDAEILGNAMRFGAMFSPGSPGQHAKLAWDGAKKRLDLVLAPKGAAFFNEATQSRFDTLTKALGASSAVRREG